MSIFNYYLISSLLLMFAVPLERHRVSQACLIPSLKCPQFSTIIPQPNARPIPTISAIIPNNLGTTKAYLPPLFRHPALVLNRHVGLPFMPHTPRLFRNTFVIALGPLRLS